MQISTSQLTVKKVSTKSSMPYLFYIDISEKIFFKRLTPTHGAAIFCDCAGNVLCARSVKFGSSGVELSRATKLKETLEGFLQMIKNILYKPIQPFTTIYAWFTPDP